MANNPVSSSNVVLRARIVDKNGLLTHEGALWFRDIQTRVQASLDPTGQLVGPVSPTIPISGRGSLGNILQFIDDNGVVLPGGIDFSRIYQNQNTNYIADGTGNPLAGGKAAYLALVTSGPSAGQVLEWNGTEWVPVTLATGVTSLDAITGAIRLVAGTGITIADNTPSAGEITLSAAAGSGYLKGTVTINFTATSGTFTGTATIAGAAVNQGAILCDPPTSFGISPQTPLYTLKGAYVSAANTVLCTATISGFASAPGNVTFPVIVFP